MSFSVHVLVKKPYADFGISCFFGVTRLGAVFNDSMTRRDKSCYIGINFRHQMYIYFIKKQLLTRSKYYTSLLIHNQNIMFHHFVQCSAQNMVLVHHLFFNCPD